LIRVTRPFLGQLSPGLAQVAELKRGQFVEHRQHLGAGAGALGRPQQGVAVDAAKPGYPRHVTMSERSS